MINIHTNTLPLPDKASFLKDYKGAAASVSVRKLFFIQLVNWVDEMESIIEEEWDKGDYSKLFPIASPFPYKLCQYLAGMLTIVKDEIMALTENAITNKSNDADHKVNKMNKVKLRNSPSKEKQIVPKTPPSKVTVSNNGIKQGKKYIAGKGDENA